MLSILKWLLEVTHALQLLKSRDSVTATQSCEQNRRALMQADALSSNIASHPACCSSLLGVKTEYDACDAMHLHESPAVTHERPEEWKSPP